MSASSPIDRLRNFGFLLKEVSRRYVSLFEVRAREISLTLPQAKVLTRLEKNEGVSQAKLADLVEVDAMAMVRLIDRMETEGLLERRPDPSDRRARSLYLTPKAKPMLDEIWRLADETRTEVLEGISNADRDVFMAVLERIYENIARLEGKSTPVPTIKSSASGG